jgi:predicted DNA-binding transcriptional regulator YafY
MASVSKNKIVAFKVLEILYKYSDENHPLSATQIIEKLKDYNLLAERKAIYRDISALEECGYDIIREKKGFILGDREFETAEIRLLIDAVQSARFITNDKTHQLVSKLGSFCSTYDFYNLNRQVFIDSRTKCENEEIFYSIDAITRAISNSKKLSYKYLKYDESKKAVPRYGGMIYEVNPYAMVWVDDAYYLIANMDKYETLAHYRVDRIISCKIIDKKRRPVNELPGFENGLDAAEYIKGRFTMFSGKEKRVQVKFHNSLRDVVYDRLGSDVTSHDEGDYMIVTFKALTSQGFFAWLFSLGNKAEILFPKETINEYSKMLIEIMSNYNYNSDD